MENKTLDISQSSKNLSNIEVLLVENDDSLRLRTSLIFKNFFFEVYTAKNFEEALDILGKKEVSYIVLDTKITDMNPLEFIDKIKSKNNLIPISILSENDSVEELMKYANLDIQGYIVKPFTYDKIKSLFSKISFYIKKHFDNSEYLLENYYYNYDKKLLLDSNKKVFKLNNKETKLLHLLIRNKNSTIKFEEFEREIWGKDNSKMTSSALRTVIKNIRKKTDLKNIENLSRIGYRFVV